MTRFAGIGQIAQVVSDLSDGPFSALDVTCDACRLKPGQHTQDQYEAVPGRLIHPAYPARDGFFVWLLYLEGHSS